MKLRPWNRSYYISVQEPNMSTQTVVVQPEAVSNMPAWPGTDKTGGQKLEINLANGSDGPNGRKLGVYDDVVFDPSLKPKPYHIKGEVEHNLSKAQSFWLTTPGTPADSRILFQDVNILDSTGADPYRGDVFVEGERFKHVGVVPEDVKAAAGVQVIEGRGRTLMSGLGDAHTHLTWVDGDLEDVGKLPVEEHVLLTAASAKTYLDSGYTMCFGAASAKDRLDIVIRNAINEGRIPGPRCLANGREIARRGGELEPGITTYADGPLEMREVIRRNVADGVNLVKLSMSGEQLCDNRSAEDCYFTDEETAACVDEAHRNKVRVCAHARAKESVKMCVRHGVDVIYHASWTDEEGMDMLVQNKSRLVVAPAIGAVHAALYNAAHIGLTFEMAEKMGYKREFDQAVRVLKEMHRRGVTVLP